VSSRVLRWIVLAFACLWFGALVPVHQRGQIQLPGPGLTACQGGACEKPEAPVPACHKKKACEHPSHDGQQPATDDKSPGKSGNCAVCHFIAGLHAPPPAAIYVEQLGLLELLPEEDRAVTPLRHAALPFHGLDPPTV
jgi:hypothetical protein